MRKMVIREAHLICLWISPIGMCDRKVASRICVEFPVSVLFVPQCLTVSCNGYFGMCPSEGAYYDHQVIYGLRVNVQ